MLGTMELDIILKDFARREKGVHLSSGQEGNGKLEG